MRFLKSMFLLFITLTLSISLLGCGDNKKPNKMIGIIQSVEGSSYDKLREGYLDALAEKGYVEGENLKIKYQNAYGEMSTAELTAERYITQGVELMMTIGTPSSKAAKNTTDSLPIVFAAVNDPVGDELVASLDAPGGNVTGVSEKNTIDKQFALIKDIFGTEQNIGVIYYKNSNYSASQVQQIQTAASVDSHTVDVREVNDSFELRDALTSLLETSDMLFLPVDPLIETNLSRIMTDSLASSVPVISVDKSYVEEGALITEVVDYYQLGYEAGLLTADILDGNKQPTDTPVIEFTETSVVVNEDSASSLGITIPQGILDRAESVGE